MSVDPRVWKKSIQQLRANLQINEGVKTKAYRDHRGYLTNGIGHRLRPDELQETDVSMERVWQWFDEDISSAVNDYQRIFGTLSISNDIRLAAILEWLFIMGAWRASKFVRTIEAIKNHDWSSAGRHMVDSEWFNDEKTAQRCFNISAALALGATKKS